MILAATRAVPFENRIYHRCDCFYAKRITAERYIKKNTEDTERYRMTCKYCSGFIGEMRCRKLEVNKFAEKLGISLTIDSSNNAVYITTHSGFWKIFASNFDGKTILLHRNTFASEMSYEELKEGDFHRQKDVKAGEDIKKIMVYISRHDKAKETIKIDYRLLPRNTHQQRKYYDRAKKKANRVDHKRINDLFSLIENNSCRAASVQ